MKRKLFAALPLVFGLVVVLLHSVLAQRPEPTPLADSWQPPNPQFEPAYERLDEFGRLLSGPEGLAGGWIRRPSSIIDSQRAHNSPIFRQALEEENVQ